MRIRYVLATLVLFLSSLGTACIAQSKIGLTVGLQPALRNQIEQTTHETTSDFPVFFMKHFTVGAFFRHSYTKYFYMEANLNASIDADWGYVSDGETTWDEFLRAFYRPNKIRADIPIYFGWYILNKESFKLRVFGCPQYKLRANTAFALSSVDWSNFSINVGVGIDLLSFMAINLNYRIPFNYGATSFSDTRIAFTVGIML